MCVCTCEVKVRMCVPHLHLHGDHDHQRVSYSHLVSGLHHHLNTIQQCLWIFDSTGETLAIKIRPMTTLKDNVEVIYVFITS